MYAVQILGIEVDTVAELTWRIRSRGDSYIRINLLPKLMPGFSIKKYVATDAVVVSNNATTQTHARWHKTGMTPGKKEKASLLMVCAVIASAAK